MSKLHKVIENEEIDGYIRGSALKVLVVLVAQRRIAREEVVEYFKELFNGGLAREYSHAWNVLVALIFENSDLSVVQTKILSVYGRRGCII